MASVCHIAFRMFPDHVHSFVDFLDALHVRLGIGGEFKFFASSDALRLPVKVSEVYSSCQPGLLPVP